MQTVSQLQVKLHGAFSSRDKLVDSQEEAWEFIDEMLKNYGISHQQRGAWKKKFAEKKHGVLEYRGVSYHFEINTITLPLPKGKVLVDISALEEIHKNAMLTLQNVLFHVDDYAHPRRIANDVAKMLNAEQQDCVCDTIWGSLIRVPSKDPYCPICDKKYPI